MPNIYTIENKTSQSSGGNMVSSILSKTGLNKTGTKAQADQPPASGQRRLSTESDDTIQQIKEENQSKQR